MASQAKVDSVPRIVDGLSPEAQRGNALPLALLAIFWVLWAVLLFGGIGVQVSTLEGARQIGSIGRLSSSVALVTAGWLWASVCQRTPAATFATLIAIGMTFGAIGDFFNAGRLQSLIPLPDPVLGGIAAFGLGHIAYIAGCINIGKKANLRSTSKMWGSILVWQLIAVEAWYYVVYLGTNEKARMLVWPSLPYSLLLAGTAGFATGLAVQHRRFTMLAVGAALFLISDMILAWELFRGSFPYDGEAVWLTYGPGQMLIVYSVGRIRKLFTAAAA